MAAGSGPHEGFERAATKDDADEAAALLLDADYLDIERCRTNPTPRPLRLFKRYGIGHPCWERIV
jgi:hypothetical protein